MSDWLGLVERLRQERRPTSWKRGVDTDYQVAWEAHPLCQEAADEIERLRAQVEAWRKNCDTLTYQLICCGVAASHPDATLTTRGAYAGKWNSAQAEAVRKLRAERDTLNAVKT